MKLSKCPQFVIQLLLVVLCTLESFTEAVTYTATCSVVVNTALASGINDRVTGTVTFTQVDNGNTTIGVSLNGFDTSDAYSQHGFHVHASNNMTTGCNSMGGHYNPTSVNHGAPTASVRHVGDMGNIVENGQGSLTTTLTDNVMRLSGDYSIIDRGLVIHQKQDDLGLGGDAGSIATGNAGPRLSCCVITSTSAAGTIWSSTPVLLTAALFSMLLKTAGGLYTFLLQAL